MSGTDGNGGGVLPWIVGRSDTAATACLPPYSMAPAFLSTLMPSTDSAFSAMSYAGTSRSDSPWEAKDSMKKEVGKVRRRPGKRRVHEAAPAEKEVEKPGRTMQGRQRQRAPKGSTCMQCNHVKVWSQGSNNARERGGGTEEEGGSGCTASLSSLTDR